MPAAIVTAAGKGMGAAIARTLCARGYDVALMSNGGGAEAVAEELGGLAIRGSVTSPDDLATLVDRCRDRYGRIDVVVNNTGHAAKGDLLALTDDDWHAGLDLLLLNVVRMTRLVTPHLIDAGGGAIVNVSTFGAAEPDAAFPISSCLRAALGNFAKLYADRHAADGIRMNNVLPGFVDSYPESPDIIARIPTGRYATTTEIADTVAFLASSAATYVNGQSVRVDGGLTRSV